MLHCLPSLRLQLPEPWLTAGTKHPPLCLFPSNFPLSLVHSVSFVWGGHRHCSGDDPAEEMFRFLCSLAALNWSYMTLNRQENPGGVLCQMGFCARTCIFGHMRQKPEADKTLRWNYLTSKGTHKKGKRLLVCKTDLRIDY